MNYWHVVFKSLQLVAYRIVVIAHPGAALVFGCIAAAVCTFVVQLTYTKDPTASMVAGAALIACFTALWAAVLGSWCAAVRPRRIDLTINERILYYEALEHFYGKIENELHKQCVNFSAHTDVRIRYEYKRTYSDSRDKYFNFSDHVISRFKKLTRIDAKVVVNDTHVVFLKNQ